MIITLGAANYAELRRFRCHLSRNDTSPATLPTRAAHRLPSPHLTHPVRLFHLAHHDGLQPTQQVAVWSLPPQGGSEGPTFISRTASLPGASPTSAAPFCVRGAPTFAVLRLGSACISRGVGPVCPLART